MTKTNLHNKKILVTGATSGIGQHTALAAARQGATVIIVGRRSDRLASVAKDIEGSGGHAHTFQADLTHQEEVDNLAQFVCDRVGSLDIVVNNAGAGIWRYLDETTPEQAAEMIAAPYLAALWVTKAFLPDMLERNSGHIVNVTSLASYLAWPGATAYTGARWALRGFTEALSADLAGTGIHVTLATFAKVDSPYWEHNPGSQERVPSAQSMIRVIDAEEAGEAIIEGIRRNRRRVIRPFMLRVVLWQARYFPRASRKLMTSTGHKRV